MGWKNEDPLRTYDKSGNEIGHALRNLWQNRAGFIVGGGPSLLDMPWKRLGERGIASMGINNVAGKVPVTAMTFGDPPSKFHYGLYYDPRILKFIPKPKLRQKIRLRHPETNEFIPTKHRLRQMPNVFAFERRCWFDPADFLTSDAATWGNNNAGVEKTGGPKTLSTFLLALRAVHYLGLRRVYLVGVDFAMYHPGKAEGNYSFGQRGSSESNNNAYRVMSRWMEELKPIFEADGFEVYNCNPQSRLTVFPHVKFGDALEDARSPVPREPFDLSGWYDKEKDESGA
jgi:hypothetical protein